MTDYAKFVGQFGSADAKADVVETRIGAVMKRGNYAAITDPRRRTGSRRCWQSKVECRVFRPV